MSWAELTTVPILALTGGEWVTLGVAITGFASTVGVAIFDRIMTQRAAEQAVIATARLERESRLIARRHDSYGAVLEHYVGISGDEIDLRLGQKAMAAAVGRAMVVASSEVRSELIRLGERLPDDRAQWNDEINARMVRFSEAAQRDLDLI